MEVEMDELRRLIWALKVLRYLAIFVSARETSLNGNKRIIIVVEAIGTEGQRSECRTVATGREMHNW